MVSLKQTFLNIRMKTFKKHHISRASYGHLGILMLPLFLVLFLSVLLPGCASTVKPPKKQDFFDKWKILAETSKGSSPDEKPRDIEPPLPDIPPAPPVKEDDTIVKPEVPLPAQKVSLRMNNANIVVVLRALARSVGQNILIGDKVKGAVNIDIQNVPWDQAFRGILNLQGLTYVREGELLRIMTVEDVQTEVKMQQQKTQKQVEEPLRFKVIPINYADATKLPDKLKEYLSKDEKGAPRGSIALDEHTNSLIVNAVRNDITKLVHLVEEIDIPTAQILIESTIVETTKDTARQLGIQWGGFAATSGLTGNDNFFVTPGGTGGNINTTTNTLTYTPLLGQTGIGGQGFGVNLPAELTNANVGTALGLMYGKLGGNILDVQLSALQTEGRLNILSSPSITTLDNQTAFTANGEKIPYVSTSQLSGTEVKFEEALLKLEITPHVIVGDILRMKIVVKKDEVDTTRNVQGNPFIIKKQTETTLMMHDGETIVISGLTKESRTDSDKGTPGLKDTPLIGRLFSSTSRDKKLEEVLIFITPHILKGRNIGGAGNQTGRIPTDPPRTASPSPSQKSSTR